MIAFKEGGMTLPMGRVTKDYLIVHRLCPHQCAPNLFKILGSVDAFNGHMRLNLTWHDVVSMYECHLLGNTRYYLKFRSSVVRLISCLPKSNKGMKDDFLIALGEQHDGLHCPIREGELGGVPQVQVSLFLFFFNMGISFAISPLSSFFSILFTFDGWIHYPNCGFASRMFLQIKNTYLPALTSLTSQALTRC